MATNNQPAFRIRAYDKQNNLNYDVGTIWAADRQPAGTFNLSAVKETDKDAQYPKMALTEALVLAADTERKFYINIYANEPRVNKPREEDGF